jgi:hypothetical protein
MESRLCRAGGIFFVLFAGHWGAPPTFVTFLLLAQKKSNQKKKAPRTLRSDTLSLLGTPHAGHRTCLALRRAVRGRPRAPQANYLDVYYSSVIRISSAQDYYPDSDRKGLIDLCYIE